jgi:hypothetical protein
MKLGRTDAVAGVGLVAADVGVSVGEGLLAAP